jgi:hypothetical protein
VLAGVEAAGEEPAVPDGAGTVGFVGADGGVPPVAAPIMDDVSPVPGPPAWAADPPAKLMAFNLSSRSLICCFIFRSSSSFCFIASCILRSRSSIVFCAWANAALLSSNSVLCLSTVSSRLLSCAWSAIFFALKRIAASCNNRKPGLLGESILQLSIYRSTSVYLWTVLNLYSG